ncbi:2-succinyl-5-enolpyruvyl-6-hydroxy-3-cyclohexene-1-carboxylic-acid synthase [Endozoicomonas arenosclerae]|uniref:2-succinyl-5-enolpyruvyl-6-hydroxy-3- cyclohexene-1-carboxylic-acid synthase n=1 Tax=Endozoicomonas arenosclerae TaxID=1633495 RepID=UPI000781E25C|nr:2-succinyl-5-enolpyruvyl-6-hydroxy-3-cyclohexene-1-carboxylic-acid synthase [Endozoicomonas arenosclerae]
MTFPTRHPSLNFLWSALILEELYRLGVEHVCIAPGSRSAPLTLVAAENEKLRKHVHFDERGLGFFALGLTKSTRKPVAVITTSGTAVANLYPAIIEARQSGVPLVILTADRPPELIDCGANQAIEQQDIYAGYPGATLKLPTPDENIPPSWLLTSIDQAFARSCQQGLPMHVNCMFREPLYPEGKTLDYSGYLGRLSFWRSAVTPHTVYDNQLKVSIGKSPVEWSEFASGKGLLIAGRIEDQASAQALLGLARRLGWPLLADVQSQLHGHPETIRHCDLLLATKEGRALLSQADRIFQVGGHLVSKRLDKFISSGEWQHYWMAGQEFRRMDTGHCQTYRLVGPIADCCRMLSDLSEARESEAAWKGQIDQLSDTLHSWVEELDASEDVITERWLGAHLTKMLPEESSLFLGNSLPIRLLDMFSLFPAGPVFTNRGASGIDGLTATAAGCATGEQKVMVAVMGDLSFLHDLNSLQLLRQLETPFVLLVINNDGGGIFNMLPVEDRPDAAQQYFVTPHGLNARQAAVMFGLSYHNPANRQELETLLGQACLQAGASVIEVTTRSGQAAEQIKQALSLLETLS